MVCPPYLGLLGLYPGGTSADSDLQITMRLLTRDCRQDCALTQHTHEAMPFHHRSRHNSRWHRLSDQWYGIEVLVTVNTFHQVAAYSHQSGFKAITPKERPNPARLKPKWSHQSKNSSSSLLLSALLKNSYPMLHQSCRRRIYPLKPLFRPSQCNRRSISLHKLSGNLAINRCTHSRSRFQQPPFHTS